MSITQGHSKYNNLQKIHFFAYFYYFTQVNIKYSIF